MAFANLAVFFDRTGRPEVAATLYDATRDDPLTNIAAGFTAAVDHVRHAQDADTFDRCVSAGVAMTTTETVHYAHHHIDLARQQPT